MLKLFFIKELNASAIAANIKEAWVRHRVRWRQELALIFNELAIFHSRGVGLLVFYALDELVHVKGDRHFFDGVAVCVNDEVVAFLVLGPNSTLVEVRGVDTRSSLVGDAKQLEEVVVVLGAKFFNLLSNVVEVGPLIRCYQDHFAILTDLDDGIVISSDDMNHAGAEGHWINFLSFKITLNNSPVRKKHLSSFAGVCSLHDQILAHESICTSRAYASSCSGLYGIVCLSHRCVAFFCDVGDSSSFSVTSLFSKNTSAVWHDLETCLVYVVN